MSSNQTNELMIEHAAIGINLLENSISEEEKRLGIAAEAINQAASAAAFSGDIKNLENTWTDAKETDHDFVILTDTTGTVLWQSEDCNVTSFDVSEALAGNIKSGIDADCGIGLALEYITPVKNRSQSLKHKAFYIAQCPYLQAEAPLSQRKRRSFYYIRIDQAMKNPKNPSRKL